MEEPPTPDAASAQATGSQPVPPVLIRALEFMRAWFDRFKESAAPPPTALHHYTDAASLISIMTTQELWATNAVFMNDQMEISRAASLLSRLLEEDGPTAAGSRGPDTAVRHLLQYVHNFVEIYVVSFCAEGDLLSQWRGYGATGGYAIEFAGAELRALGPGHPLLVQVTYDEEPQLEQLRELLRSWRSMLASVSSTEPGWFKGAALLAQVFGALAVSFKDEAFAEEKEWRLCYSRLRLPETLPEEPFVVDFRSRGELVIPFVRFQPMPVDKADDSPSLPITGIRVGPHPYPALAASGVWHLINEQKNGSYVKVSNSAAPLRR